jgi:phosphomevalonate kinase
VTQLATGDSPIATSPGKLLLAGEYAVLDGSSALLVAVDRRAVAHARRGPRGSSPLFVALAAELERRFGASDPRAVRALDIEVDSSRLFDGPHKLGLGSSAATTVAATAFALGSIAARDELLAIATAAHAAAQARRGAAGSGADIAACVYGGTLEFARDAGVTRLTWPSSVHLLAFFTGQSADTPTLVGRVAAARVQAPAAVDAALAAVASAARAACQACATSAPELAGPALLAALALAANATDQLAAATGVALVPACVRAVRTRLAALGGTAKTTGAGGGDVAIVVVPAAEDATNVTRWIIEAGGMPLDLAVDETGVDLRPAVP